MNPDHPALPLSRLLSISRPRFWLYELGTYAVGVAAAVATVGAPGGTTFLLLAAFFLYFLLPANLFIYGINDIHDYDTDRLNPKKVAYETLVMPDEHPRLRRIIAFVTLPSALVSLLAGPAAFAAFAIFLLCAWQYSAPPIRAKARPVLDSLLSAGHYVATGAFGYLLAGGDALSLLLVLAGMAWAVAMHAYSAVPDIDADTRAGLSTIATKLGRVGTLIVCTGLYASATLLASTVMGWRIFLLGAVYLLLMILSLRTRTDEELFRLYGVFPYVNAAAGALLFFAAALA